MDNVNPDTVTSIQAVATVSHTVAGPLSTIGAYANQAAKQTLLQDYQARKSAQTLRRQNADVALFERFLAYAGEPASGMGLDLAQWAGVSWGLVEGFNRWQLLQAYAIGSINVRLATVKAYALLATKAGYLSEQEYALIKTVKGYRDSEGRNIDEKRPATRQENAKKAAPVSISPAHATLLKKRPDSKRGRRDALLMCLLLEHGLRVGEISDLNVSDIDLASGKLIFYRHKVDLTQEHDLTPDTLQAAQAYLADCTPGQEALFVGLAPKNGIRKRVNERSLNHRVVELGKAVGLAGLSPHDCRHFWATDAIRNGTDVKSLQDAGGWSSPAMPLRYAEASKVANKGVKLSSTKRGNQ